MDVKTSPTPRENIPIARPATPTVAIQARSDEPPEASLPWYQPEDLKGWCTSLGVHLTILIAMAFWVFSPNANPPRIFDSRLAGSEDGVDGGLTLSGGLNTEYELTMSPEQATRPTFSTLAPLEVSDLGPKVLLDAGADKSSAGGGMDNNNPGAGSGDGFGLARFGQGGESIRGVEVKVGDPQFTLLWDSEADLDLHVIEPGGKEIYWEDPKGKFGGELDVDNTKGFGPENIYWLKEDQATGTLVKGAGPPGEYRWYVKYWGGFGGIPRLTRWKVRIKHEGKVSIITGKLRALNEQSKVYTLKVETSAPAIPTP